MQYQSQNKVCCFGELLLRFSPVMQGGFIKDALMPVFIGGAELNAATALANWNIPVKYITALPDNELAQEITAYIAGKNIDTSSIHFSGERIGSYFLPQGTDLKNNAVIYDRNYSSFSNLLPGDIDWNKILADVSWFHFSAISPALNENAAAVCMEAVKAASEKGITISVDLNYRAKLWQYGKQPIEVMPGLIEYCDVIMGNIWSAEKLAGIDLSNGFDPMSGNTEQYLQEAELSAKKMFQRFSKASSAANTFRFDEGEGIKYFATLHQADNDVHSSVYRAERIMDKIGSGDCFMAGLISGLIRNYEPQTVIDFAAAAAFTKLQQKGDATTSTIADVEKNIK